jgi:omega-6 fatty acid desaturase / acyl-lipid omega-6 desaturase (Delta-12 desaturase)
MSYVVWDFTLLGIFLWTALTYIPKINPENINLPHPALYKVARFAAWAFYDLAAGLVATGLWVIAHECGHQAFSTSKTANNAVGWVLHSAYVHPPSKAWLLLTRFFPLQSWCSLPLLENYCMYQASPLPLNPTLTRLPLRQHAKHHAQTSHLTGDQVFVPKTRSERGLPPLNAEKENLEGSKVNNNFDQCVFDLFSTRCVGVYRSSSRFRRSSRGLPSCQRPLVDCPIRMSSYRQVKYPH